MIQPIMDRMFLRTPAPAVPEKARLMDFIFRTLKITEADVTRVLPIILVIVIFGKGSSPSFRSFS